MHRPIALAIRMIVAVPHVSIASTSCRPHFSGTDLERCTPASTDRLAILLQATRGLASVVVRWCRNTVRHQRIDS
jgi:hypothetical protein